MAQAHKAVLRVALSTATLFAAGLVFLPLLADAEDAVQEAKPWSLVPGFDPDAPVTNCCTGRTDYVPMTTYANPAECLECHKQPTMAETWDEWEVPEEYSDMACKRFDY